MRKSIKVNDEVWSELMLIKYEKDLKSIEDVLIYLLGGKDAD